MPQQSLSDFVSNLESVGMLVRVIDEKRVDELPRVMEDHPTTFLANAYSNQDQYAWAMQCEKAETGRKMVEASQKRIAPIVVNTAPSKEVIITGDNVDMTIFPMFLRHERDGQSYSDDNLVVSKDPRR
jgi:4-hydroxy-3-polyprenylbenzoate decarboxylase